MYGTLFAALECGSTIVTANNRLARTLAARYDAYKQHERGGVWPTPDVLSWNAWLRRTWSEARLRGADCADHVCLPDSAADVVWQRCVAEDKSPMPVLSSRAIAAHARLSLEAWRLVHEWDLQGASEWTGSDLTPEQQSFLRWSGRYRQLCSSNGWIDSAQLCLLVRQAVHDGLLSDLPHLVFAGFDLWTPQRVQLREALIASGVQVIVHDPEIQPHTPIMLPCADRDGELLAAAAWARDQWELNPDWAVCVVVPDLASRSRAVERVFLDILAPRWRLEGKPAALPVNISYGRPLAEMPMIHAALELLDASTGRLDFDDISLLMRSAWLPASDSAAGERARAELYLRNHLPPDFSLSEVISLCQARIPQFAEMLQVLNECARATQRCGAYVWTETIVRLLDQVGWPGRKSLNSGQWQVHKAWNELLSQFAAGDALLGLLSWREAVALVRQIAHEQLFQVQGPGSGIQVMGVLEAAGHVFDRLWVCGMSREQWPLQARPNPFIPGALQRRQRMPESSPERTLAHARRVTGRLLASAPEVIASWPQEIEGQAMTCSPLLASGPHTETRSCPDATSRLWNLQMLGQASLELLEYDPPPVWDEDRPVPGGARVISLQATSPLNAFIESRLGAFRMEAPEPGITPRHRGILTHRALEVLYRDVSSQAALADLSVDERQNRIKAALDAGIQRIPGHNQPYMRALIELELSRQMSLVNRFVDLELARPPFADVCVEESHEVQLGPLQLRLKIDRSDYLENGGQLIIDYKTGQVRRQHWNPARPGDLQLPLYATCALPEATGICFVQLGAAGIVYDGVGTDTTGITGIRSPGRKQSVQVRYQCPDSDEVIESWDELRNAWNNLLHSLAEQFAAGDFRFDPRNPDSARGQFAVLSRIYDIELIGLEIEP